MRPARTLLAVLPLAVAVAAPAAWAEISPEALAQVGVHARAGAVVPLTAPFVDQNGRPTTLRAAIAGRPTVLLFEDYRCNTLCGPALAIAGRAIADSGLAPGRDVGLVAVSLNPRETAADGRAIRDARLAPEPTVRDAGTFLTGPQASVTAATRAMGFGYAYDPASGQYTHPVAAFVLTPDGRLSHVLSQINMTGPELRDAVRTAEGGGLGAVIDQLALVCHGISVAAGRYNGAVALGLKIGALATLALMAAGLGVLVRRGRRA